MTQYRNLIQNISSGNFEQVRQELQQMTDKQEMFNATFMHRNTILHYVFSSGNEQIIKLFLNEIKEAELDYSTLIQKQNRGGYTPVDRVLQKNPEDMKALFDAMDKETLKATLKAKGLDGKGVEEKLKAYRFDSEDQREGFKKVVDEATERVNAPEPEEANWWPMIGFGMLLIGFGIIWKTREKQILKYQKKEDIIEGVNVLKVEGQELEKDIKIEGIYYNSDQSSNMNGKPIFAKIKAKLKDDGEEEQLLVTLTDGVQLSLDSMGVYVGTLNYFKDLQNDELKGINYEIKSRKVSYISNKNVDKMKDYINYDQIIIPITSGRNGGHTVYFVALKEEETYKTYIFNQSSEMQDDKKEEWTKVYNDIKAINNAFPEDVIFVNNFLPTENEQATCAEAGIMLFEALNAGNLNKFIQEAIGKVEEDNNVITANGIKMNDWDIAEIRAKAYVQQAKGLGGFLMSDEFIKGTQDKKNFIKNLANKKVGGVENENAQIMSFEKLKDVLEEISPMYGDSDSDEGMLIEDVNHKLAKLNEDFGNVGTRVIDGKFSNEDENALVIDPLGKGQHSALYLGKQNEGDGTCASLSLEFIRKMASGFSPYTMSIQSVEINEVLHAQVVIKGIKIPEQKKLIADYVRGSVNPYNELFIFPPVKAIIDVRTFAKFQEEDLTLTNAKGGQSMLSLPSGDDSPEGGSSSHHARGNSFFEWIGDKFYSMIENHLNTWNEAELKDMAVRYGVEVEGKALKDIRLELTKVAHPDKDGNHDDMTKLNNVWNEIKEGVGQAQVDKYIGDIVHDVQNLTYKATVGIKAAEVALDIMKAVQEPSQENIKNTALGGIQLYGVIKGVGWISTGITALGVADKVYEGKYAEAATLALTTTVYTALPYILGAVPVVGPAVGITYTCGMTVYAGYHLYNKAHSWYYSDTASKQPTLESKAAVVVPEGHTVTTYYEHHDYNSSTLEGVQKIASDTFGRVQIELDGDYSTYNAFSVFGIEASA